MIKFHAPFDAELNPEVGNDGDTRTVEIHNASEQETSMRAPKRTRWEPKADESVQKADAVAKRLTDIGRKEHWAGVKIPDPLCLRFQQMIKNKKRSMPEIHTRIALLQKIIFADKQCKTSTPLNVLEQIMDM